APGDNGYDALPGIWTLLGGMWILHFSYWGFNQYIIQRALGAKDLAEAQKGLVFAAFLKMLTPLVVVLPGIAAVMLSSPGLDNVIDPALLDASICSNPADPDTCGKSDRAYPTVMKLLPSGIRGLIFAALIAAIVSSLASMMNSIATIFTMDVYEDLRPGRPETQYVAVGRLTALVAGLIALFVAQPLLGNLESAFQFIQKYTGFIAPGIVAVFLLGMFWKRATEYGALAAILGSLAFSILLDQVMPSDFPFVINIVIVFAACILTGVLISVVTPEPAADQPVNLEGIDFSTTTAFKISALIVVLVLAAIYAAYW
ncbi:MAG: sodium transporter, partial [Gammaproteobacteria bacterium]|nr:sodium transporter [Gammaproteobacteria bacterium]